VNEHLVVVAESVEEIEDGEFASSVRIVAGGKNHAVVHGMREDFAGKGIAFDAGGCGEQRRTDEE
jgi:hypothetical protein